MRNWETTTNSEYSNRFFKFRICEGPTLRQTFAFIRTFKLIREQCGAFQAENLVENWNTPKCVRNIDLSRLRRDTCPTVLPVPGAKMRNQGQGRQLWGDTSNKCYWTSTRSGTRYLGPELLCVASLVGSTCYYWISMENWPSKEIYKICKIVFLILLFNLQNFRVVEFTRDK